LVVIAHIKDLIAGLAEIEALKRSISYTEAGVDAILIHMKSSLSVIRGQAVGFPLAIIPLFGRL